MNIFTKYSGTPLGYDIRVVFLHWQKHITCTVDPPQGRTFFEHFFRPYRPSLTTKLFPLWFPYKNTSVFFLQKCYCSRTNGGLYCILTVLRFIAFLLPVRRLLSNYLSMGKVIYCFIWKHLHVLVIIFVGFLPDIAIGPELQSGVRFSKKIHAIILIYC